jgi:hypothetical protein
MNEYINRLKKQDAMISTSLQETLSVPPQRAEKNIISIKAPGHELQLSNIHTFSLDSIMCEVVFEAGITTVKKIQDMINEKCMVSFYNFEQELQLVSYVVGQITSTQMMLTLKFVVG